MTNGPSLKDQNAWLLRTALFIHIAAFSYVAFEPLVLTRLAEPDALQKARDALAPGSIAVAVIAIAKLLLLGLVPAWLRDRLIHWRWQHPLPGARAFSSIGPADPRIDMAKLENLYGQLPTEPGAQGKLFYSVYSDNAAHVGVLDAHKSYLAARDIGIINLLLFPLLPPFAYWATQDVSRTLLYATALVAAYVLTAIAAQVYARRFVENSLAAACTGHT